MCNLRVVNARSSKEPDPAMLTASGLNPRPYFEVAPAPRAHSLRIVHGAYQASLYRPTRRQRLADWWERWKWTLLRDFLLFLCFLITFMAINAILSALLSLADWLVR